MSRSSHSVCVAWLIRVMFAAVCPLVHGCTNVSGGAVELSWKLRAASGGSASFVTCDSAGNLTDSNGSKLELPGHLVDIRLHWEHEGVADYKDFKCSANHGVTGFQLPPGEDFLWVSPVCDSGYLFDVEDVAPNTFSTAAPEQRTVIAGNTISLGAIELVLQVWSCNLQPCICCSSCQ